MGFILRFFSRSNRPSRSIARQRLENMLARERTRILPPQPTAPAEGFPAMVPPSTERSLFPQRGFFR